MDPTFGRKRKTFSIEFLVFCRLWRNNSVVTGSLRGCNPWLTLQLPPTRPPQGNERCPALSTVFGMYFPRAVISRRQRWESKVLPRPSGLYTWWLNPSESSVSTLRILRDGAEICCSWGAQDVPPLVSSLARRNCPLPTWRTCLCSPNGADFEFHLGSSWGREPTTFSHFQAKRGHERSSCLFGPSWGKELASSVCFPASSWLPCFCCLLPSSPMGQEEMPPSFGWKVPNKQNRRGK